MKTLESLLALGAGGFLAFRSLNHLLLTKFFRQTQLRIKVLQAHRRDLASEMRVDEKGDPRGMRIVYKDDGLCGWHSPVLTSRTLSGSRPLWAYPLVGQVVITHSGKKGLAVHESFSYLMRQLYESNRMLNPHLVTEDQALALSDLFARYRHEICQRKPSGLMRTKMQLRELTDEQGQYMMTWESEEVGYGKAVESEELPEVTLTVPHERLRQVSIDENGVMSTKEGSSYLFLLTEPSDSVSPALFLKLLDPSQHGDTPLDLLLCKHFIPDGRKILSDLPIDSQPYFHPKAYQERILTESEFRRLLENREIVSCFTIHKYEYLNIKAVTKVALRDRVYEVPSDKYLPTAIMRYFKNLIS
jgi:hypothetical protein